MISQIRSVAQTKSNHRGLRSARSSHHPEKLRSITSAARPTAVRSQTQSFVCRPVSLNLCQSRQNFVCRPFSQKNNILLQKNSLHNNNHYNNNNNLKNNASNLQRQLSSKPQRWSRMSISGPRVSVRNFFFQRRNFSSTINSEKYPHSLGTEFTGGLDFIEPGPVLPTYRVMDSKGKIVKKGDENMYGLANNHEELRKIYRTMVTLNSMDNLMYNVQRQGRISFYMTAFGEEAAQVASAAALDSEDTMYAQYREGGALLYRGFTINDCMNQLYSNILDNGKGRQMPVHYGSRKFNFQTISSPLATQIPQAAGAAYALKREGKSQVVVCYFGEGAASEGDFHAALNFAAVLRTPTMFFVRNNGYAISTPVRDQYKGDGIASRASGYGMKALRFDGNDVFAVYNATRKAREMILEKGEPVLLEAVTFRMGHHSTSDDASAYRPVEELNAWQSYSPIDRLQQYMVHHKIWTMEEDDEFKKSVQQEVIAAMKAAEKAQKPAVDELFLDVYDELTPPLVEQRAELYAHLEKYPDHYPMDKYGEKH